MTLSAASSAKQPSSPPDAVPASLPPIRGSGSGAASAPAAKRSAVPSSSPPDARGADQGIRLPPRAGAGAVDDGEGVLLRGGMRLPGPGAGSATTGAAAAAAAARGGPLIQEVGPSPPDGDDGDAFAGQPRPRVLDAPFLAHATPATRALLARQLAAKLPRVELMRLADEARLRGNEAFRCRCRGCKEVKGSFHLLCEQRVSLQHAFSLSPHPVVCS